MYYIYDKKGNFKYSVYDLTEKDKEKLKKQYILTTIKYIAPILKDNKIVETSNTHLTLNVADGTIQDITLGKVQGTYENELIVEYDNNIIEKQEYYSVIDNKLIFNEIAYNEYLQEQEHKQLEIKRSELLEKTKELEHIEKEKAFEFKGYLQPNRELQDQTSLLKIISFMQISKQKVFNQWKMKDKDGHEHYLELTLQELIQLGQMMEQQTTQAMVKWSNIREQLKSMDYGTLKSYELPK